MFDTQNIIFYGRVSTSEQGQSGLGLQAQRAEVERFAASRGMKISASYTEVISGGENNRPELARAIDLSQSLGHPICVAKLDRLSRNVHFISGLMETGTKFIVAGLGMDASPLLLHISAAVSEDERKKISDRTRAALAELKKNGVKLGNPNIAEARVIANQKRTANADQNAVRVIQDLVPHFKEHALLRDRFCIQHLPWWSDRWGNPGSMGRDKVHLFVTTTTTRGNKHTKASLYRAQNRVQKLLEGKGAPDALLCLTSNARNEDLNVYLAELETLSTLLVELGGSA
jgi:DNA invertase Pin-like site-specific DNA recombinase